MGKQLVITEKPSVAHDIADALGGFVEEDEYLESEDYVVTWAVGHLLELAEPKDYDKTLRSWSIKHLPIIPDEFQIKPREGQKKRLDRIKKLGKRKDVDGIINACDAGREGELIYRRIAEYTGLDKKPQQRLWLRSMTPTAITDAFDQLRPGKDLEPLAHAAWLRSVGDWLVGMNATRALTQRLKSRGERGAWSAGRVQTPTLALLVKREREILAHVPEDYWELVATFSSQGESAQTWEGRYHDPDARDESDPQRRPSRIFDRAHVDAIVAGLKQADGGEARETRKKSKQNPPLLFDLTSLQREANKRYSMSAKRTLNAAQRLYEGHKLTTYPRTDSRYLPDDYGPVVGQVLASVQQLDPNGEQGDLVAISQRVVAAGPKNLKRLLDSNKVSDHFAIVPTGNPVPAGGLSGDDERVWNLIVRQFVAALMGPATWATVERYVDVEVGLDQPAMFRTTARSLEIPGFLEALGQLAGSGSQLPALVPGQDKADGVPAHLDAFEEEAKQTKPPGRYSEAQLLRMMETAGERVDDDELSDAMRDRGLGTPATRADTIEGLVRKQYARRIKGKLSPSSKAMRLMDVLERVHAEALASPKLTGEWEYSLHQVAAGETSQEQVHDEIVQYTKALADVLTGFDHDTLYEGDPSLGTCPSCGGRVVESAWGYPCENNDGKESECDFIIWKDRMGRYIDRSLVSRLLEERTVGPLEGFTDRAGRRWLTATLNLTEDDGKWVLQVQFGDQTGEDDEPEEIIGEAWPCPEHEDCTIVETSQRWVCKKVLEKEEKRGPVLPKKVCQRDMSPDEIAPFFAEEGKTAIIDNFISRRGRPFRGALFRKPTGKHGFEFPPREKKKKKSTGKKTSKKGTAKKGAAKKSTSRKKGASSKKGGSKKKA